MGKQASGRNTSLAWRRGEAGCLPPPFRNASHERAVETAFCSTLDGESTKAERDKQDAQTGDRDAKPGHPS